MALPLLCGLNDAQQTCSVLVAPVGLWLLYGRCLMQQKLTGCLLAPQLAAFERVAATQWYNRLPCLLLARVSSNRCLGFS
jgi:hypothetical protein